MPAVQKTICALALFDLTHAAFLGSASAKPKMEMKTKSEALPWSKRPDSLVGTNFVGDSGFDPLGLFGSDPWSLGWDKEFYREAEIKHARLAMLAALAFPVQEKFEPIFAALFRVPDELIETAGRSPTILNGGLEQGFIPLTIAGFLAGGAFVENVISQLKQEQGANYAVGDVNFDPLQLYGKTKEQQLNRQLQELQFGRMAMVAILLYVIEEAVFKTSVLAQIPAFFSELSNFPKLEVDIASGIKGLEAGSADLLRELGDVKALEGDVASFSGAVEGFVKEGDQRLLENVGEIVLPK